MSKTTRLTTIAVLIAGGIRAQDQIATVTSVSSFTLRGLSVSVGQGVPYWPVLDGDTINAGTTPGTVTLPDQSALSLAPGSEARLTVSEGRVVFRIVSGSVRYSLKSKNAVVLMANGRRVVPTQLAGVISSSGPQTGALAPKKSWGQTGHTLALGVVNAGIVATVSGVAVALNSGPSISPSR